MRIKSINFIEHEGNPQQWTIKGLSLSEKNLIVGKNASGKSRALNIISSLAGHLSGSRPLAMSGNYDVEFSHEGKILMYHLKYEDGLVVEERFTEEGNVLLNRGKGGEGEIWAADIDGEGKKIRFQTPPSELSVVARQDAIQHQFLEPLFAWGSSLRHYHFGTPLGKDHMAIITPKEKGSKKPDDRDENRVVGLYREAEKVFGNQFKQAVINDMREIDYYISDIGIAPPVSIIFSGLSGEMVGLYVKEEDLLGITDQHSMSQGMFRTFSIFIQINYSQMAKKSTCILIDDIGEGLDFDRSCRLIDLLRRKAEESNIQLILSTNDRFVMNRVPLEEWSVLQRRGSDVRVMNYENSREQFEEFKFTGLSNFSLLEMDFLSRQTSDEDIRHE
jgi:energy-coupling factor transporter ATP-binding protein EcfA2